MVELARCSYCDVWSAGCLWPGAVTFLLDYHLASSPGFPAFSVAAKKAGKSGDEANYHFCMPLEGNCVSEVVLKPINSLPTNDGKCRHDLCELSISLWEFIWGF